MECLTETFLNSLKRSENYDRNMKHYSSWAVLQFVVKLRIRYSHWAAALQTFHVADDEDAQLPQFMDSSFSLRWFVCPGNPSIKMFIYYILEYDLIPVLGAISDISWISSWGGHYIWFPELLDLHFHFFFNPKHCSAVYFMKFIHTSITVRH